MRLGERASGALHKPRWADQRLDETASGPARSALQLLLQGKHGAALTMVTEIDVHAALLRLGLINLDSAPSPRWQLLPGSGVIAPSVVDFGTIAGGQSGQVKSRRHNHENQFSRRTKVGKPVRKTGKPGLQPPIVRRYRQFVRWIRNTTGRSGRHTATPYKDRMT